MTAHPPSLGGGLDEEEEDEDEEEEVLWRWDRVMGMDWEGVEGEGVGALGALAKVSYADEEEDGGPVLRAWDKAAACCGVRDSGKTISRTM